MAQTFTRFPATGQDPNEITAGPDGNLWFTQGGSGRPVHGAVTRITPAGVLTNFELPFGSSPRGITVGADGAFWVASSSDGKIYRITTAGAISSFALPIATSLPLGITLGPDGNVWFSEFNGSKIGRITPAGIITEFPILGPPVNNQTLRRPREITVGSDGALWFVAEGTLIGRITTLGVYTEFAVPQFPPATDIQGIAAGSDGNLWFSNAGSRYVGRITTAGVVTTFQHPTGREPFGIKNGPDGALWFLLSGPTGGAPNLVGRITTTGVMTEFALPTAGSTFPVSIATGPDGNLWFTDLGGTTQANPAAIWRLVPPPASSQTVAALLPGRSVQVGQTASAFVTMLNANTVAANNCGPMPVITVPADYNFQTTNPASNTLTGTPNTRVSIPAQGAQTFAVFFKANAPFAFQDLSMGYGCDGLAAAVSIVGVNTFPLTFSATPVPDVITVGDTLLHDGYAHIAGVGGSGFMVTAATNIGAAGNLTARVRLLDPATPVNVSICETNLSDGTCKSTPAPSVTRTVATNENTTWTAFFTATAQFAQDPARYRALFEFVDAGGTTVRGQTSTALTLQ